MSAFCKRLLPVMPNSQWHGQHLLLGFLLVLGLMMSGVSMGFAQERLSPPAANAPDANLTPIEQVLHQHTDIIQRSSRRTIQPAIDALRDSGLPEAALVLERWREKQLWAREADGRFFTVETDDRQTYTLRHVATDELLGTALKADLKEIKPNSGIRGLISGALVQFQLSDPDPEVRRASLDAIQRDPDATHLAGVRGAIENEPDPALRLRKERLERLLTIRFDRNDDARIAAIKTFGSDLGVDVRATLNPILSTRMNVSAEGPGENQNLAAMLVPGRDIPLDKAYAMLAEAELAPTLVSDDARDAALVANIADGDVAGVPVSSLNTEEARITAYQRLSDNGLVPPFITPEERQTAIEAHQFYTIYTERNQAVTAAAEATLASINAQVAGFEAVDLTLDAISLASIYFLAAIGLAITFGVMGVINMAHGEFIMIGAYTGYVVQQFVPDYTLSILLALPLAFAITFVAGVAMERLVIRWLYHRPLETLLATFGISIALQQLAKNIFGTQARPLTSPDWLDGAWVLNDVVAISYIRIAIFVMAVVFFLLLLFILNRTRLGLEVRAVTQNPRMAASMGINIDRVNMLTFGLGSGIAGIAGVAIGLFAKVTSELGSDYIVQSFMTVVVGGVGNIFGTLAGATLIGFLQKGIEWFNPANTLAAQTYMIIFIIIFIQFRPRGIIALRGRAAGD
jgi:urea transport system permease protein